MSTFARGFPLLRPRRRFGADCSDPEFCPPELAEGDAVELPESIEAAAAVLEARGLATDPRRIDIYQLGTLFCRLITGQSVVSYMYTAGSKGKIPAMVRSLLERALGYNAADRFEDAAALAAAVEAVRATIDAAPASIHETPPQGSIVGRTANTPQGGHPAALPLPVGRIANPPYDPLAGKLPFEALGQYRILARVGHGGMGDVYRGYDESLKREVAVKVLPAELARSEDFVRRFHAEAAAAAQIAHPNVVPLFSIGEDAGHHYFAMQYIRGESLAARLALKRRLPVAEALDILQQCLAGLGAAHARGLIHRDIKPGNILLDAETGRAMLVDFGLVRRIDEASRMTATGVVMGTVDYIAPEQARGLPVDCRADLYAMGIVAYQLLAGRLPFTADTPTAMVFQHAYEKPYPLEEAAPDVPAPLLQIVARLMAKVPAERYQTAAEVLADLQAMRDGRPLTPFAAPTGGPGSGTDCQSVLHGPSAAAGGPGGLASADAASPGWDWNDGAFPAELPEVGRYGSWQRARDLAATMFRRHAPEFLQQLQSTTQQVDGALAHYQRRRNRLADLVCQGERVLADLPDGPDRERQRDEVEAVKLELAKADATLARLRSQRDLLQARLRVVGAGKALDAPILPGRRRRRTVMATTRFALAAAVGMVLLLRIWGYSSAPSR